MQHRRARLAGFLAATIFPFVVYVITLAREITFIDSGELAAVAATLGIAHPPGYPLFTLLGHLFAWLPFSTVCFRVGLLSATAGALAAGCVFLTAELMAGRVLARSRDEDRGATILLPALAAAWLFAFARTPWSQAVVVEVYALQGLLSAFAFYCMARAWERGPLALQGMPWIAFAGGLALTNHLTGAFLVPALLLFIAVAWIDGRRSGTAARPPWGRSLLAGLLPLGLYLYLPLRAAMHPAVFWDLPVTLRRLWVHVSARQYQGALGSQGLRWSELERFVTRQLPGEATWILVALAALGLALLLVRARRVGVPMLITFVAYMIYNMAYPFHDISLFYIPALALVGMWAGVGATWLTARLDPWRRWAALLLGSLLCAASLWPLAAHWRENDQSDFGLLRYFLRDSLVPVEPNAIVFSSIWDRFSSPAVYYQSVEGLRPDVMVIDMGMIASPALAAHLAAQAPDLLTACQAQVDSLAAIAHLSERGASYDVAEARGLYDRLQQCMLDQAVALRPTYITSELHRHPMMKSYRPVAEGLLARVYRQDGDYPYVWPEFEGPGIVRAQARDEREEFVHFEYGRMAMNRARYLERRGHTEEAAAMAQRAQDLWR